MPSTESYIPVRTESITCENMQVLENVAVGIEAAPVRSIDQYFSYQVISELEETAENPIQDDRFHKISKFHGRSYEMKDKFLWSDEFGNRFMSISIKGNNLTNPHVMRSATAPSGFIPMGLMEGDALLRIIRASNLLREKNISSEAVLGILKPSELVTHGTKHTQNELKNKILLDAWNKLEQGDGIVGRNDFLELSNAFNGMEFFFLIRALKVSERISELDGANDKEFEERLTSIFRSINLIERSKNKKGLI